MRTNLNETQFFKLWENPCFEEKKTIVNFPNNGGYSNVSIVLIENGQVVSAGKYEVKSNGDYEWCSGFAWAVEESLVWTIIDRPVEETALVL